MGKGRCRAKAQGHRGERSLSLPGETRIEPGGPTRVRSGPEQACAA